MEKEPQQEAVQKVGKNSQKVLQSVLPPELTTSTTLSEYLAITLLVVLPFLGFWLGIEYATNNTLSYTPTSQQFTEQHIVTGEQKKGSLEVVGETRDLVRILAEQHPATFTEVEENSFEWHLSNTESEGPAVVNMSGYGVRVLDEDMQTEDELQEIDQVTVAFLKEAGFRESFSNVADNPTNNSSLRGFEDKEQGTVCLRTIVESESQSFTYTVACASAPTVTIIVDPDVDVKREDVTLEPWVVTCCDVEHIRESVASDGQVLVIATLDVDFVPEGELSAEGVMSQRAQIADMQNQTVEALGSENVLKVITFESTPSISLLIDGVGLEKLLTLPQVIRVQEDIPAATTGSVE